MHMLNWRPSASQFLQSWLPSLSSDFLVMKQFIMFLIVNGGNSTLCMDHQFAARWNSLIVFGELVLDEKTSTFFFLVELTIYKR